MAQVNQCRNLIGQLPARRFFIIGHNIAHSLSPTIHNAAFKELGLPHHYSIHQSVSVDETVEALLRTPDFGGASVTFPHKLNIRYLLDSIAESAEKVGAVNTVIVEDTPTGRHLRGDNTDWIGILRCIQRSNTSPHEAGLVIGAGGAARAAVYAFQQLGLKRVILVNRTLSTAEQISKDFPSLEIEIHQNLEQVSAVNLIVSCIPADDIAEADIPQHIFQPGCGVLIDMAYRPPVTALMQVAKRIGSWTVLGGVDVLKEQAYCQFELWTERKAPVKVIEEALARNKTA